MALLAVVAFRFGKKMPEPEQRGERDPAVGTQIEQFHLEPLTGDCAAHQRRRTCKAK